MIIRQQSIIAPKLIVNAKPLLLTIIIMITHYDNKKTLRKLVTIYGRQNTKICVDRIHIAILKLTTVYIQYSLVMDNANKVASEKNMNII